MYDYKRHLPHWQPDNKPVFLTWRLYGSLPRVVVSDPRQGTPGEDFVRFDHELDQASSGPTWLSDPKIARLVVEAFQYGELNLKRYVLAEFVVMPNHVHLLCWPRASLAKITQQVKGYTARQANVILGRKGRPFWQDESYDHWVRDRGEMHRIARYIVYNPVKAGLAVRPEDWAWSSAHPHTAEAGWTGWTACPTMTEK
jgi:REP element-mobilizing transposase RayT